MTVFENPSPQVVARWGTPHPAVLTSETPQYEEAHIGKTYEGVFRIDAPRPLTPGEAYVALSDAVRRFEIEHPEAEVRYVEIRRGSQPELRFQFKVVRGRSPIILAVILAGIALAATIAIGHFIATALVVFLVCVLLMAVDDFLTPDRARYKCKCDEEFDTVEEWRAHWMAAHPTEDEPDWERAEREKGEERERFEWAEKIKKIVIITGAVVGGLIVLKWVLPALGKPKPG